MTVSELQKELEQYPKGSVIRLDLLSLYPEIVSVEWDEENKEVIIYNYE